MEEKKVNRAPKRTPKKKVCSFCVDKIDSVDYKDVAKLKKYITEKLSLIHI